MSKPLEEMTYEELVDYSTQQIFGGLINGGTKEMHSRVYLWLSQAIQWRRMQDDGKKKKPAALRS